MPKGISKDCADILTKILETDPDKRYTADDIKKHPWYSLSKPICRNEGLIIGKNEIPIEPSLLSHLEKFGFKRDYATASLNRNKHNQVTTVYYLLHKRFEMEGKLASCFKVKTTPVKDKKFKAAAERDVSKSPDPKESFKKKLFTNADSKEKDHPDKPIFQTKDFHEQTHDSRPRDDNLSDLIRQAKRDQTTIGDGISPKKANRRRDRTEGAPEDARNREKARKILQNFDFSKLFNPVSKPPRNAKSQQVGTRKRATEERFGEEKPTDFENV